MNRVQERSSSRWDLLSAVLTASVIASISFTLSQMPVPIADMLDEIVDVETTDILSYFTTYLSRDLWFFRPLEFLNRYIAQSILGGNPFGYNLFAIATVTALVGAFWAIARPANFRQLAAYAISLSYLVGHHAFAASLEFNIVISNLVISVSTIGVLFWAERDRPGSIGVVILCFIAVAVKEIGLVIPALVVIAHFLKIQRLSKIALFIVLASTSLYVIDRGLNVVSGIEDTDYGSESDRAIETLLLNSVSTGTNVLTGFPLNGDVSEDLSRLTDQDNTLWFSIRIAAAVLPVLLIVAGAMVRSSGDEAEASRFRRLCLLGVGGLAATSALGFFYLKDRHGVVLLPLLSYILFLSIDRIFRGTICDTRGFLLRALILSAAVSTSVRVGGTIAAERELAVDQKASWILMLEDLEGKWSSSPDKIEVVRRYARFADSRRLATTAYDPPWIKEWLGGKASINR